MRLYLKRLRVKTKLFDDVVVGLIYALYLRILQKVLTPVVT